MNHSERLGPSEFHLPTPGENAVEIWRCFEAVRQPVADALRGPDQLEVFAAVGLVRACVRLRYQLPGLARDDLLDQLPFSRAEWARFEAARWADDPATRLLAAERVHLWIFDSPVVSEGREAQAGGFLEYLAPFLDLDYDRNRVRKIARYLINPCQPLPAGG